MHEKIDRKTPYPVSALAPILLALVYVVPVLACIGPLFFTGSRPVRMALLAAAPMTFALFFGTVCAALSRPFQRAIVPGKFPRRVTHLVYGPRRLYGLCWGAVFYCTPFYYAVMSVPPLRRALFRAFGYRGHHDVTIAPDAWIRDLPLLSLGQGSYVANKATLGTNMCLSNGTILVDGITTGKDAMVGHLAMIAPGCVLGDRVEVGVGCGIGIRVRLGNGTRIGPCCVVNHGARLGELVDVGTMSYVGLKAVIADRITLPGGSIVPDGAEILTQEDVARCTSSEARGLPARRELTPLRPSDVEAL